MNGRFRLLALGLVAGWGLLLEITLAFDTGHHWELTAQVMQEMGFNEPSRQTACVSNWMVDYYSSSPTASKRMREELSKLHCDNLYTAESARRHLARRDRQLSELPPHSVGCPSREARGYVKEGSSRHTLGLPRPPRGETDGGRAQPKRRFSSSW